MIDADDTAKTISSLALLGTQTDPAGMLAAFANGDHFRTYVGERNASFSANCNILVALLYLEDAAKHVAEIELALRFLCKIYREGELSDKWVST